MFLDKVGSQVNHTFSSYEIIHVQRDGQSTMAHMGERREKGAGGRGSNTNLSTAEPKKKKKSSFPMLEHSMHIWTSTSRRPQVFKSLEQGGSRRNKEQHYMASDS